MQHTILVVDDAPENLRLLRRVLTPAGYLVREASSAEEALTIAAKEMPDLIFLDLRLGEGRMSGYDVVSRLRDLPGGRKTAIVALSGGTSLDDEGDVRKAGFDGFIMKPVDIDELPKLAAGYLEGKKVS